MNRRTVFLIAEALAGLTLITYGAYLVYPIAAVGAAAVVIGGTLFVDFYRGILTSPPRKRKS